MVDYNIRNLMPNEMFIPVELASREKWNPGLNDHEFLLKADNNGFFVAHSEQNVIGTIASVNYQNHLSFIGLHIVLPEFRNKGVGEKLLSVAIEKAGENNIGLNCFENMTGYYEKAGFKPAFKILQYEGTCDGKFNVAPGIVSPLMMDFELLYSYEKKIFPYERKVFTSMWVNQPKSMILGKYADDEYKGYGLFVPCVNGYRISPLVSDDPESAEEILTALTSHFPEGMSYFINIPERNKEAVMLAEKLNLKKINETVRMYTKEEQDIELNKVYSFATNAIG